MFIIFTKFFCWKFKIILHFCHFFFVFDSHSFFYVVFEERYNMHSVSNQFRHEFFILYRQRVKKCFSFDSLCCYCVNNQKTMSTWKCYNNQELSKVFFVNKQNERSTNNREILYHAWTKNCWLITQQKKENKSTLISWFWIDMLNDNLKFDFSWHFCWFKRDCKHEHRF